MRIRLLILTFFFYLSQNLASGPAVAQDAGSLVKKVVLPGESRETAARLAEADRLVHPQPSADDVGCLIAGLGETACCNLPSAGLAHVLQQGARQKWAEALEEYQRIIYDEGDNLVVIDSGPASRERGRTDWQSVLPSLTARSLCHRRIAAAPPWALALYQKRMHNLAETLFGEGSRDPRSWYRLVNDHFCSVQAGQALELIGDMSFEAAEFDRALQWWAQLSDLPSFNPEPTATAGRLLFPANQATRARVQAKQVLALAFRGQSDQAQQQLKAFQKWHGGVAGVLAGKKGPLGDIVNEVLERLQEAGRMHDPVDKPERPWTSFAGDGGRNAVAASAPQPRLWVDGPTWRVHLATGALVSGAAESPDGTSEPAVSQAARRLPFHPIITQDKVLVAGARTVTGYHLLSGEKLFRYDLKEAGHADGLEPSASRLPAEPDRSFTLTVSGKRIYVRLGGQKLGPAEAAARKEHSFLICLEMRERPADVREVWHVRANFGVRRLDAALDFWIFEGSPVVNKNRVFLAMSKVTGQRVRTALACYDAATGVPRWIQEVCDTAEFEPSPRPRFRHHLVTLAGKYLVYCSHAGAVVAVDADTGKPAWAVRYPSRGPKRADGSASPRDLCPCLFSADRLFAAPMDCDRILCLNPTSGELLWEREGIEVVHLLGVAKGKLFFTTPVGMRAVSAASGADQEGWAQPAQGKLPPYGRGLLAGGWIFWPTLDPQFPLRILTQSDGDQDLAASVDRSLRERGQGGPAQVFDPTQLRRLRAGNMVYVHGCLVVAGMEEMVAYVPPRRFLPKREHEAKQPGAGTRTLYRLAQAEADAGLPDQALAHFRQALQPPAGSRGEIHRKALDARHDLLVEMARQAEKTQIPADLKLLKAGHYLQEAMGSEFPVGCRLRAGVELAGLFERSDKPGRTLATLQSILLDDDLRSGVVCISEPRTPVSGNPSGLPNSAAFLAKARIRDLVNKHGAEIYAPFEHQARRLLKQAAGDTGKLEQVVGRYPNSSVAAEALREQAELRAQRKRPVAAADSERPLAPPLYLAWQQPAAKLVVVHRISPHSQHQQVLCHDENRLSCRDARTAQLLWSKNLTYCLRWAGLQGDRLIVAGDADIDCLHVEDGTAIWAFRAPQASAACFGGPFGPFHLTASRLVFLDDGRRVLALSLEQGNVLWSRDAPGALLRPLDSGRFSPHFLATDQNVLLQTNHGQMLCLDSISGKMIHEGRSGASPWAGPPLPLGPRLAGVAENGQMTQLDLASGKELWKYQSRWPTSSTGEAGRCIGNEKTLLVVVPRNYGFEVERLDARTGQPLWADEPRLLSRRRADSDNLTLGEDVLYYVGENVLTCRSLRDGKTRWKQSLPLRPWAWQTRLTSAGLVVGPAQEAPEPWSWLPLGSFLVSLPSSTRPAGASAIFLFDAKDGKMLQRLDLSSMDPRATVEVFPSCLVAASGGMVCGWRGKNGGVR